LGSGHAAARLVSWKREADIQRPAAAVEGERTRRGRVWILREGQPAPGPNDALATFWSSSGETSAETAGTFGRGYLAYLAWRAPETARAEQASDVLLVREALPEMFTVDRVATWTEGEDLDVDRRTADCGGTRRAGRPGG
jgi:hypothetical protein